MGNEDKTLDEANFLEFLRLLVADGEGGAKPAGDIAPPGFVSWVPLRMDPEDYLIAEWDGDESRPPGLHLDYGAHGAAYAIATTTLLHLRRWWRECSESYADKPTDSSLEWMRSDLREVIRRLQSVDQFLGDCSDGSHHDRLGGHLSQVSKLQDTLVATQKKIDRLEEEAHLLAAKANLAEVLTASPAELLAFAESDTTNNQDEE